MVIAFVGSTLPYHYIVQNAQSLGIDTVVCSADRLAVTYARALCDTKIRVVSPGQGRIRQVAVLTRYLCAGKPVIFFHECCWPMVDILYLLFRPAVSYIPQVSLNGWEKVSPWSVPGRARLRAVLLAPWFDVYRALAAGGGGYEYVPALRKKYGMKKVSIHRTSNDLATTHDFMVADKPADKRRAIIVVSRDVIPDAIIAATISSVLTLLDKLGYSIDIKDHPNPDFRLGLNYPGARTIDATLPVEMILPHYPVIVGVASTSLARTSATHQRVISVLRLLPKNFAEDLSSRLAHLAPLAGHIAYPADFEALERLLVPEKCVDSSRDTDS